MYSLACTAFELLTGSSPFAPGRDDAALIAAHLQAPIPSAAERRPTVPDAVDRVLAGGLSKDAAGRPASAGDFVQALNDAFAESTVLFERPAIRTAEEPPPPSDARRRWWIPAAIATAAVALVVAGVLVVRSFGGDDAAPVTTEPSTTLAPTSAPPASTVPTPTAAPTLPPVPPGAIDLGFGAYVPLAAGWQVAGLGANSAQLTDGVTSVSIVVQRRQPGSTARDVLLEQTAGVDAAFPAVWYGVPTVQPGSGGSMASQRAAVGYRAYGDGGPTSGQAIGVVRADGLALGYVQRAAPGTASTAYPGFDDAVASLVAAPPVATPAELADPGTAAVPSSHPQLVIDGSAGFTPAPSYRVVDAPAGSAFLTANGTYDVFVRGQVVASAGELTERRPPGHRRYVPGRDLRRPDRLRAGRRRVDLLVGAGVGHLLRWATAHRCDRHVLGSRHDAGLLVRSRLVPHRGRHRTVRG